MQDSFVMFPMNQNGVFWRPEIVGRTLQDAMYSPFAFADVFVYSHGWATVGNAAMITYGEYIVEFQKNLVLNYDQLEDPPKSSFGVGIHWPSTLSEDQGIIQDALDLTTFYQMGARAQEVGNSGVYAALSLLLKSRYTAHKDDIETMLRAGAPVDPGSLPGSFRLTLLGHSFGCRVVCSALERICKELKRPNTDEAFKLFVENQRINAVLLQAAFKKNELDVNGNYSDITPHNLPHLKILITTSQLDRGLNEWFPAAENLNNLVHLHAPDAIALGAGLGEKVDDFRAVSRGGGPTDATANLFGAPPVVPVGPGFTSHDVPTGHSMIIADLTPIHLAHLQQEPGTPWAYTWQEGGGSHSDISSPEIYNLINGFCFKPL